MRFMIQSNFTLLILFLLVTFANAQKEMTPEVYKIWNSISNTQISHNGQTITYELHTELGSPELLVYSIGDESSIKLPRARNVKVSPDGNFVLYIRTPDADSVRELRRRKVEKDLMPKDSLIIYEVKKKNAIVFPHVSNFQIGLEDGQYVCFSPEIDKNLEKSKVEADSNYVKQSKDMGQDLLVYNLATKRTDTIAYVTYFEVSPYHPQIIYQTTHGLKNTNEIIFKNLPNNTTQSLYNSSESLVHVTFSEEQNYFAFMTNTDTTDSPNAIHRLHIGQNGILNTTINQDKIVGMASGQFISPYRKPSFNKDGSRLYFGVSNPILIQDTSMLDEEIVQVEIWHYQDQRLYTQQENQVDRDKKDYQLTLLDVSSLEATVLENEKIDEVILDKYGKSSYALGIFESPYKKYLSWLGYEYFDLYVIDLTTNSRSLVASKETGYVRRSPNGR